MFQFPWFPLLALCVQARVTPHDRCRVSPFGHLRIDAWSTAPRSFSQSPTSFFGSRRQGIHRWLFVAWKSKMLVLAMEFSRCGCRRRGCRRVAAHRRNRTGPRSDHARALRHRSRSASWAGCPFKTEQKEPGLSPRPAGGNSNLRRPCGARGSNSQWSTGCSLERHHRVVASSRAP
jgi:hypothetical protein